MATGDRSPLYNPLTKACSVRAVRNITSNICCVESTTDDQAASMTCFQSITEPVCRNSVYLFSCSQLNSRKKNPITSRHIHESKPTILHTKLVRIYSVQISYRYRRCYIDNCFIDVRVRFRTW